MKITRAAIFGALVMGCGTMVTATGCFRAPPQRMWWERHNIVKIPKIDVAGKKKKDKNSGGEGEAKNSATKAHQAVWLARYVWEPYTTVANRSARRLKAVEIIFCPADKSDFTQCRVGVAWSRSNDPRGSWNSSF